MSDEELKLTEKEQSLKRWVKALYCPANCKECEKTSEKCRQDLYLITQRVLQIFTKIKPKSKIPGVGKIDINTMFT